MALEEKYRLDGESRMRELHDQLAELRCSHRRVGRISMLGVLEGTIYHAWCTQVDTMVVVL